jgi:hypothetical protein
MGWVWALEIWNPNPAGWVLKIGEPGPTRKNNNPIFNKESRSYRLRMSEI